MIEVCVGKVKGRGGRDGSKKIEVERGGEEEEEREQGVRFSRSGEMERRTEWNRVREREGEERERVTGYEDRNT